MKDLLARAGARNTLHARGAAPVLAVMPAALQTVEPSSSALWQFRELVDIEQFGSRR
jgi:hypothetical protein